VCLFVQSKAQLSTCACVETLYISVGVCARASASRPPCHPFHCLLPPSRTPQDSNSHPSSFSYPHAPPLNQVDDLNNIALGLNNIALGTSFDSQGMARSLSSRGVVFEWNILKYKVKLKKRKTLTVLRNITGRAESGSFSAIMGPSGCGKTSLLDCLALRTRDFKGGLALDGKPLTGEFYTNTGYVNQKELFFPHLTVREHLIFHAINRLSSIRTDAQCKERVATVMEEVDLTKVADQKIGGGDLYIVAGLSGGERKRLNIATELLADPRLLLLDEPTSGTFIFWVRF